MPWAASAHTVRFRRFGSLGSSCRTLALCFILSVAVSWGKAATAAPAQSQNIESKVLFDAMNKRDIQTVDAAKRKLLSAKGVPLPEVPEYPQVWEKVDMQTLLVSRRKELSRRYLQFLLEQAWWRKSAAAPDIPHALRAVADIVEASLILGDAYPELKADTLLLARSGGDYILSCSEEAHFAGAPFPHWRNRGGRLGDLSARMIEQLNSRDRLKACLVNGWLVVPEAATEYYFDTGSVGAALVELYNRTGDIKYLAWSRRASDWAHEKPIAANFNYNSFLALMDSRIYRATGNAIYLQRAADRTLFGVIAGEVEDGAQAGHWLDSHNERVCYRKIMVKGLMDLSYSLALDRKQVVPLNTKARIYKAASSSLSALEKQISQQGYLTGLSEVYQLNQCALKAGASVRAPELPLLRMQERQWGRLVANGRGLPPVEMALFLKRLDQIASAPN